MSAPEHEILVMCSLIQHLNLDGKGILEEKNPVILKIMITKYEIEMQKQLRTVISINSLQFSTSVKRFNQLVYVRFLV